ncbi:DUF2007 domain-containing protein [Sulfuriroseicoccus oceanibius]|uniref:DUF2007 domain-containing protein n=1 Tax=Sulfuriroseicoccus oceanibius TaxID=2707525 RepID=A0A6B3LE93_9BACT|nr:DUF2007 domain-containing protein [Sulfuriroseicoccus oceanibius]QQL45426.1 DUF2007 domain-containing protein [Sulfuriroseicoccus oceanibius]
MKELFREADLTRVSYFETILKGEGIPTMIRNKYLTMSGLSEIPIPEFFPALCVINDDDYPRAVEIIQQHLAAEPVNSDHEIHCPHCHEPNPANFQSCWSCGKLIDDVVGGN